MVAAARLAAFEILVRVEKGGWADELVHTAAAALDPRDAGLATEIVFGTLRHQSSLDFAVKACGGRDPARFDPEVRIAARMGAYQLLHLDRVPKHAVVNDSVELVKRARKASAAGMVNAILRKLKPVESPVKAVRLSTPEWLLDRWTRQFGEETALSIASEFLKTPPTYVRASHLADGFEPAGIPGGYRVTTGNTAGLRVQDISSQWVVTLLDLSEGQRFLDVCAAPGNKTAQALETAVRAVACDISSRRLASLDGLAADRVVLDATQPLPFGRVFDRILVDAPCSGTGTIGRNPEIKWRLNPGDFAVIKAKQVRILSNALECLKPGGRLVYSTCSLELEENEEVVEQVLRRIPEQTQRRMPGRDTGDGFFAAVIPSD